MLAQIQWNPDRNKYELVKDSKVLLRSKSDGYLSYVVSKQKHAAVVNAGVTGTEVTSWSPVKVQKIEKVVAGKQVRKSAYSVDQRFEFMKQMINMVVNMSARSMVISGEGGVGKTFSVIQSLEEAGKVDFYKLMPTIAALDEKIVPPDTKESMKLKAEAMMNRPSGDYVVIKGRVSPASLFRILYEHRSHIIVFDDCDAILRDSTSIDLLKSACDSYEERWVHWRVERAGDSDLPLSFPFAGSVIFVTNMPLTKIDEAIKTRCFKVDLAMSKQQRIERMRAVLSQVRPEITDLAPKEAALNLLEKNLHLTNDINFRTLMNLITIKMADTGNWEDLAKFTLTEQ